MSIRQPQKLPTILSVALMSAFSSVFHFPWSKRKPIQVLSGSRRVTVPELQGAPCARVGNIGGIASHEYHVATAIGEDTLLVCNSCNYAANQEKATGLLPHVPLHPVPVSDAMSQQLLHRVEVLPLRSKSLKVAFASTKDLFASVCSWDFFSLLESPGCFFCLHLFQAGCVRVTKRLPAL
eukprot:m.214619 g.214619  ORF g.214619 m.214619 type:complete len:180 (-) comp54063_c0_seq1:940-1479(-)